MKSLFSILLLLAATTFPAYAAENEFITQPIRLACGYTTEVWTYIDTVLGEGMGKGRPLPISGEESARYFVEYEDGSWLLTLEFHSLKSSKDNFSCIVATGRKDSGVGIINAPFSKLPKGFISSIKAATRGNSRDL